MRGKLLPTECPICHGRIETEVEDHLFGHEKRELVRQVIAYLEAIEQDGVAE